MSVTNRPTSPCKNPACGNTLFVADYDTIDGQFKPVWQCTNCCWNQLRQQRNRKTNAHKAFANYMELREAWKSTDEALQKLVDAGLPSGCLLVHSSLFCYHLIQLSTLKKPKNFDIRYHTAKAKEELKRAKLFVEEKQNANRI